MNILPKVIIFCFLILVLTVFAAASVHAAQPEISVYFSKDSCSSSSVDQRIKTLGDLSTGTSSINLCFDTGAIPVTGFELEIVCNNSCDFKRIAEGVDASNFIEIRTLVSSQNKITGTKSITDRNKIIAGKLHIAIIALDMKQTAGGSIKFNKALVPSDSYTLVHSYDVSEQIAGGELGPDTSFTTGSTWAPDSEVTFAGKFAVRANDFLKWTLKNFEWSKLNSSISTNPFSVFWSTILKIVYALALLLVLISAMVMIISRGRSLTIMRFIPRFILVLFLATFSFSLIQIIYQTTDIVQGFFLKKGDGTFISVQDLLNMDFGYKEFIGYRLTGAIFDESVFVSLLLVKLTALTYYIMSGVLLIRKVILWFFLIVSPVFPLLLLYYPIRNTAKIWIGEFFRWLLYAPIFAIFLSGLVTFWTVYIPLFFDPNGVGDPRAIVYPTAVNILLGGPGQDVSKINSINLPDTFILYVVSLLMLWAVIILPFILLRIFLDYLFSFSFNDVSNIRQFINTSLPFFGKYGFGGAGGNPSPPVVPVSPPSATGIARSIPFINKLSIPVVKPAKIPVFEQNVNNFTTSNSIQRVMDRTREILRGADITIPTIKDIARIDSDFNSSDTRKINEVKILTERLEKLSNPSVIGIPSEIHEYNNARDELRKETVLNNNSFAQTILSAAAKVTEQKEISRISEKLKQIINPANISSPQERLQFAEIKNQLIRESNNSVFAQSVLSSINTITNQSKTKEITETKEVLGKLEAEKQKGNTLASNILSAVAPSRTGVISNGVKGEIGQVRPAAAFPVINRVQTVSMDDYEAIKEMWIDNYKKQEVPVVNQGIQRERKDWINEDKDSITETINLLSSSDQSKVKKGMEMVGNILPFLLIGGFSQTEVIAYLKAKLQAAKTVLSEIGIKEEEEETTVGIQQKSGEKEKEMEEVSVVQENKNEDELKVQS